MHVRLASIDPEVRDVWFLTKPEFERSRFLGTYKPMLDLTCSTYGFCHKYLDRSAAFNMDLIMFMTVRMFLSAGPFS
jgi:hypothetical protein